MKATSFVLVILSLVFFACAALTPIAGAYVQSVVPWLRPSAGEAQNGFVVCSIILSFVFFIFCGILGFVHALPPTSDPGDDVS